MVEPLLALPPKKIALILGHINKSHRIDTLENEPYNQFLKEASRIGIKPTILANRISHLIDEKSIHRLTFFAPLNSNINEYCRRGPENNIVPFRRTWMYQTKPLTFAILTGKWQQASILLKNKDIRLDVDKEVKHYVGPIGINVDLPKIIALIAKHNVLPPEALGFIAELEERMGATKPFVKQTKKSRSPRLKP